MFSFGSVTFVKSYGESIVLLRYRRTNKLDYRPAETQHSKTTTTVTTKTKITKTTTADTPRVLSATQQQKRQFLKRGRQPFWFVRPGHTVKK